MKLPPANMLTVDAYPLIELRIWGPEILQLVVPGLRFSALIAADSAGPGPRLEFPIVVVVIDPA